MSCAIINCQKVAGIKSAGLRSESQGNVRARCGEDQSCRCTQRIREHGPRGRQKVLAVRHGAHEHRQSPLQNPGPDVLPQAKVINATSSPCTLRVGPVTPRDLYRHLCVALDQDPRPEHPWFLKWYGGYLEMMSESFPETTVNVLKLLSRHDVRPPSWFICACVRHVGARRTRGEQGDPHIYVEDLLGLLQQLSSDPTDASRDIVNQLLLLVPPSSWASVQARDVLTVAEALAVVGSYPRAGWGHQFLRLCVECVGKMAAPDVMSLAKCLGVLGPLTRGFLPYKLERLVLERLPWMSAEELAHVAVLLAALPNVPRPSLVNRMMLLSQSRLVTFLPESLTMLTRAIASLARQPRQSWVTAVGREFLFCLPGFPPDLVVVMIQELGALGWTCGVREQKRLVAEAVKKLPCLSAQQTLTLLRSLHGLLGNEGKSETCRVVLAALPGLVRVPGCCSLADIHGLMVYLSEVELKPGVECWGDMAAYITHEFLVGGEWDQLLRCLAAARAMDLDVPEDLVTLFMDPGEGVLEDLTLNQGVEVLACGAAWGVAPSPGMMTRCLEVLRAHLDQKQGTICLQWYRHVREVLRTCSDKMVGRHGGGDSGQGPSELVLLSFHLLLKDLIKKVAGTSHSLSTAQVAEWVCQLATSMPLVTAWPRLAGLVSQQLALALMEYEHRVKEQGWVPRGGGGPGSWQPLWLPEERALASDALEPLPISTRLHLVVEEDRPRFQWSSVAIQGASQAVREHPESPCPNQEELQSLGEVVQSLAEVGWDAPPWLCVVMAALPMSKLEQLRPEQLVAAMEVMTHTHVAPSPLWLSRVGELVRQQMGQYDPLLMQRCQSAMDAFINDDSLDVPGSFPMLVMYMREEFDL